MIKPINNNGSVQLKWTAEGHRYSLSTGGQYGDPRAIARANQIASEIELDLLEGTFDKSLERYRPAPKATNPKPKDLLSLWDLWVASLSLSEATLADHYRRIRRMMEKASPRLYDTGWLLKASLSDRTKADRVKMLRSCFKWAVEASLVTSNPWLKVHVKVSHKPVQVFSLDELGRILGGFQEQAPSYYPFVLFLASTGCRLSEAIGLRWLRIDLEAGSVTLADSLSIDRAGDGYKRVMKPTKTGSIRTLPLTNSLKVVLTKLKVRSDSPESLVFRSPQGHVISAQNFRKVWKRVLELAKVPYRKPHCLRHSLLSHALDQGQPVTNVAAIAGHRDCQMVLTTYGHLIGRIKLPDLGQL